MKIIKRKKVGMKVRKSLETVVAVTYTHTQAVLNNEIARNSKTFNVLKNRGNLEYNRI